MYANDPSSERGSALAESGEDLRQTAAEVAALRDDISMAAAVRGHEVVVTERGADPCRDRLLTKVQVHRAEQVTGRVQVGGPDFELPAPEQPPHQIEPETLLDDLVQVPPPGKFPARARALGSSFPSCWASHSETSINASRSTPVSIPIRSRT